MTTRERGNAVDISVYRRKSRYAERNVGSNGIVCNQSLCVDKDMWSGFSLSFTRNSGLQALWLTLNVQDKILNLLS